MSDVKLGIIADDAVRARMRKDFDKAYGAIADTGEQLRKVTTHSKAADPIAVRQRKPVAVR